MNVYVALHKAIREHLYDGKMAVYITTGDKVTFLGNVNLNNRDSILNFVAQYGDHEVIGIRMLGITISEKPLDYVPDYDKNMLMRLIEDEI